MLFWRMTPVLHLLRNMSALFAVMDYPMPKIAPPSSSPNSLRLLSFALTFFNLTRGTF
jgi:hypothetical protein